MISRPWKSFPEWRGRNTAWAGRYSTAPPPCLTKPLTCSRRSTRVEVHLATGFQNLIYDSPHFPKDLRDEIYKHLDAQYSQERKPGETEEQFLYKTRKKAFGDFKKEMWHLPEPNLRELMRELENRFSLIFQKLNVVNTLTLLTSLSLILPHLNNCRAIRHPVQQKGWIFLKRKYPALYNSNT